MNAGKRVHAQKPYPSQAFAHESSKVGGRGKREENRQERHNGSQWEGGGVNIAGKVKNLFLVTIDVYRLENRKTRRRPSKGRRCIPDAI